VKTLHRKLFPPPKAERWVPQGVYVTEENGEYSYADEESKAVHKRCEQLGIIPNIYVVSDDWHPDMDGTVA
jgi:hypothetical protein